VNDGSTPLAACQASYDAPLLMRMPFTEPFTPRRSPWPEITRIGIIVVAALAVMWPFFTSNVIGGVDARWYAYMLADYIEQARLGHLLVPVGQGSFAWNGSVHLFRSAPVYMAVARVWDILTFQRLNPFALEHLTAITSAVAGTLGFYAAAVKIAPNRRWIALGLALLYLGTPSWLSTVLYSEAYMSYMAFAALPLVLYGNARTALGNDGRGYVILGAGLALLWMCHPPIAFTTTLATLVIQSGLIMGRRIVSWNGMAAGIVAFAVLAAYYFISMSEVPPQPHQESKAFELTQILGFALFFTGIGRFALVPRAFGWALCAGGGAFAVWMTSYPWFCWAAATACIWFICAIVFRAISRPDFENHAFVILFLSTLAGAAVAEAWVGRDKMFVNGILTLAYNTAHFRDLFTPMKASLSLFHIFQPGWGLVAVFAGVTGSLFGSRPLGAKLFFAVALGLVLLFLRVPLVSNFLVGRLPIDFAGMVGVPLALRIAPVIASFTAMAGVVWIGTADGESRAMRFTLGAILSALVVWCGYQDVDFVQHSREMTGNANSTDRNLRHENAMLDAYAYLLLPIPSYFSHGKTDPILESRLLDSADKVVVGPVEDAEIMEAHGVSKIRLTTRPIGNSTTWFAVGPVITVAPKEHLLLRFEFDPKRNYNGFLIFEAEHSYREYHLPDSGMSSAFGVGDSRTTVLSLWNSGPTPEHYTLSLSGRPGNDIPHSGGFFANLYVSNLDVSALPIRLTSLIPYRAQVKSAAGGTLETFRAYMPGYRATVDGGDTPVSESREHLVSLPVPPGTHEVVLRFAGSARLRIAAVASGMGWLCLLGYWAVDFFRRRRPGVA
jgi:hypothetical protein